MTWSDQVGCLTPQVQITLQSLRMCYRAFQVACNWAMSYRSSHVIKLKLSSQLIGQFGHVTASASCKQPEKHGSSSRCSMLLHLTFDLNVMDKHSVPICCQTYLTNLSMPQFKWQPFIQFQGDNVHIQDTAGLLHTSYTHN